MAWIHKYLSAKEIEQISQTVHRVEENTDGEIVPVIVKSSSSVGHVPMTLTLLLLLVLVIAELPFADLLWVTPWVYIWPFLVVAIYYISFALAKMPFIQKVFVPERDEVDQVHQRAHLEFYLNKIHRTNQGTGILIFVSVMERKAVILADEGINGKLPPETWNQVLAKFGEQLNKGNWAAGFNEAIEACGKHLHHHFPHTDGGHNQLKNHLVIR
ncbi:TPM domain-containing protein [Bdellovibrio sp. HCB185ZH]|uniref:TPM domain-containing protein n=1 Tax=Bdellovibrio sp. HCB185ZH TaxID=3394235 RepID=UPI0039A6ACDA